MVYGTRGNESTERSGVQDEEHRTKDRAMGIPQEDVHQEDRSVSHLTRKQRDERCDLNQLRTKPWIPNQDERWMLKMSLSIVSNAAEMSSGQRHDTFYDPIALTR